jgi:hypothetical protein
MINSLIMLVVVIIVVGIVAYLVNMLIDMIPMEGNFKQIAKVLVILVAVLIVLAKALPLIGVSI